MSVDDISGARARRCFLLLAFDGLSYHGWQRQPGAMSVQQAVEEALSTVLRLPAVAVTGAGRTDAGVSAALMPAHVDLPAGGMNYEALKRSLNSLLAPHIVVRDIVEVPEGAHARFDATGRTYRYFVHTGRTPFAGRHSWQAPPALDFDAMNLAARQLLSTDDFTSFAKLHTDTRTNICRVTHAAWHPLPASPLDPPGFDAGRWYFEITADRFLRNMVRAVVGTLVEVGRGKLSVDGFSDIIARRDRCAAGTSMPGGPLFLYNVTYPYLNSTPI